MKNVEVLPDERLDNINEDLSLVQLKTGLTFGTDAYLLSAFVKSGKKGADLGAGTGVASLLCLSKNKLDFVYTVEIQERFAELCRKNAALNEYENRIRVIEKDVRCVTEADTDGTVDVVISNPPYMKSDSGLDNSATEMNIARREIFGTLTDFCAAASRTVKYGGLFYTVYRPERLCDLFCALRENSLEPKRLVTVYPDTESCPCLVLCESKKGASPSLINSKPLIIYKSGTREYTEDMQRVYDTCSLSHLFK